MIAAICDDDVFFRKQIHEFLVEYKRIRRVQLDIVEFSDGNELLQYEYPLDIVLLDYDMPILDGMETARQLRAKKSLCCIVFITSFPQHVFEAFEVNTYRYLLKPVDFITLEGVLDHYIQDKKMLTPITVNMDGEQITVNSEDIMYLEADGKYCIIRTTTQSLHSSKTLSQVFDLLPQHCFYRTHKSYAVNLYCISSIKENLVVLTNKERVRISRNKLSAFKDAYKNFIKHFVWDHH